MVGPSGSPSATINSTSSQASPANSSTSKGLATTDTTSSQTVGANQDPSPPVSPTSKSSSAATSQTSSSGGDVTAATDSTAGSNAGSSTGTQIAIPSHKADSGSATPTASDQGVSSSSFSPTISQGHTQSSSDVSIPPPLPPTSIAPSLTAVPTASLPLTTVSLPSTRIMALPAPPSTVPSSSQPILTPHVQGTVASGGSGASASPTASQTSSIASFVPSDDGSKAPSAIAQESNRNSPVTTSTVTDKPETTLSTPVFFTVTDAQNHTTISEPPVFTSVEFTTSNGQQVSVTHVIANPTGIWGVDDTTSSHGFFSNSGAVAGVFLVVGLVIAAIFAGIFFFFRRRRRRAPRFIESISRPLPMPDDPFEDPRTLLPTPEMHYAPGYAGRTLVIAGAATPHPTPSRSPFDSDADHGSSHSSEAHPSGELVHGLGLAGVGAGGGYGDSSQSSFHSRSRQPSHHGPVGLAITTDVRPDSASSARREPSSAQSSPSIYPPSLPTPSGEDDHSLVDVPLSNDGGATRFPNTSATRLSSPTTRKPVPLYDLPEPIAPIPRSTQQQQAEQTNPPVIPPRSPLRRNSTVTSRSLSRSPPPVRLASIQTQLKNPELANAALQPYEPLTPPTSLVSLSPAGSSSGHEALTPISPADANAAANPFSDAHAQRVPHAEVITAFPMTRSGDKRETFYTRTRGSQRRPSVEWRQRD
ncbi:hypothetical protein LXA43DRAFT_876770 [Ganoderma leucocontextum]|nr:hypothetical protein LXA43DRAFT_876770 [Ganoderma leucocontextum]